MRPLRSPHPHPHPVLGFPFQSRLTLVPSQVDSFLPSIPCLGSLLSLLVTPLALMARTVKSAKSVTKRSESSERGDVADGIIPVSCDRTARSTIRLILEGLICVPFSLTPHQKPPVEPLSTLNLSEVSQSVDRCAAPAFLKSSRGHIGVEPERN